MENIKEDERELSANEDERELSATEILRNLKETDPDVRTLINDIMMDERKVMYNKRRPKIHVDINNHIQRLIR